MSFFTGSPAFPLAITAESGSTPPASCPDESLPSLPFVGLTFPADPVITSTVSATTDTEIRDAIVLGGCHVTVLSGSHAGNYFVFGDDTRITINAGAYIENIIIGRSVHRVIVEGPGTASVVDMDVPIDFPGGGTTPEYILMATDLRIQCLTIDLVGSRGSGIGIRGPRVLVSCVNFPNPAPTSCVWAGDYEPLVVSDATIIHSRLEAGTEATVRLQNMERSVVYDCQLWNNIKHNYRIHGMSEDNYCSDSVLTTTGFMMGNQSGTPTLMDNEWFIDNTIYYDNVNGVFILSGPGDIFNFTISGNTVFTDDGFTPPSEPGWTVTDNTVLPYTPAPPYTDPC